ACTEMVMELLGGGIQPQCVQASVAFGIPTCCMGEGTLEPAGPCDKPWRPELDKWGFDFDFRSELPLSWEEFTNEIDEGRPFLFAWIENPPITHMLVAIGYHEAGNDKEVFYFDPLAESSHEPIMAPFSRYDGQSGEYRHRYDYFWIRPRTF